MLCRILTIRFSPAHLAQRYGRLKQEIEKLKAMEYALADAPEDQISLTDPDARAVAASARNSGLVGYNAQCAVDTGIHIIVTHDATNKGFDSLALAPFRDRLRVDAQLPAQTRARSLRSFGQALIIAALTACVVVALP